MTWIDYNSLYFPLWRKWEGFVCQTNSTQSGWWSTALLHCSCSVFIESFHSAFLTISWHCIPISLPGHRECSRWTVWAWRMNTVKELSQQAHFVFSRQQFQPNSGTTKGHETRLANSRQGIQTDYRTGFNLCHCMALPLKGYGSERKSFNNIGQKLHFVIRHFLKQHLSIGETKKV